MTTKPGTIPDPTDAVQQVSTTLPVHLVEMLNARIRKNFTTRAIYVRQAIISAMRRDGYLADAEVA